MLELAGKGIIYVFSLYMNTGGPRTLHQLANYLIETGKKVYIVYFDTERIISNKRELYGWNKVPISDHIIDSSENVLVVPEVATSFLRKYQKVKKVIYWLSLDYYLRKNVQICAKQKITMWNLPFFLYPGIYLYYFMTIRDKVSKIDEDIFRYYHMYNCLYVKEYLANSGVAADRMHYLCGPIQDKYFKYDKDIIYEKEKIIAVGFNRAKTNTYFVRKVIRCIKKKREDILVIPVAKMSSNDVVKLFKKSMLYIDFGVFPGPERQPREAVTLYCNLLISNCGAGANYNDYPIPDKYKLNLNSIRTEDIANIAIDMVDEYYKEMSDFETIREKVRKQQKQFEADANEIFE